MPRKRILFIAEAATFAHIIRPLVLAQSLDPEQYDVHFAYAKNDLMRGKEFIFEGTNFTFWNIYSQPSSQFAHAIKYGTRLFKFSTLKSYAEEEINLFKTIRPDIIVGDMRLSLSTSSKICGIPYISIHNAHWSPNALNPIPRPEYPILHQAVQYLGERFVSFILKKLEPYILAYQLRPINRLRQLYKLPKFLNFFDALTAGDYRFYADMPGLFPHMKLDHNEHLIGPINWEPNVPPPSWWDKISNHQPIVYVAMGSSGRADLLPMILNTVRESGMTVILAGPEHFSSDHIFASPFFPWDEAAKRSVLMIGNGGSGAIYQAIRAGIPLIGIVANQDQLIAMSYAEKAKCGIMLRSNSVNSSDIKSAINRLLSENIYKISLQSLQRESLKTNTVANFNQLLIEILNIYINKNNEKTL